MGLGETTPKNWSSDSQASILGVVPPKMCASSTHMGVGSPGKNNLKKLKNAGVGTRIWQPDLFFGSRQQNQPPHLIKQ